jgi:MinD-like ATPase involved in chromosome partitioning or flagellar assembly
MPYLDAPDGTPPDRLPPGQPADPGMPRPGVDPTGSHQARDRAPHQPPGQPPIQPGQGRHQTPARGPGDERGAVRPQYGNGYPAGPAPVHPSPGPHHQQPAPDDGYGGAGHETGHRARGYDAGPPYPAPAPTPLPPQRWAYDERTNGDRDAAAAAQRAGLSPAGLSPAALLPDPTEKASRGWRKVVWQATGGAVNPGLSPDEVRHRRLLAHIRTPLHDCHRIAVMSLKGGVGKTTTTIGLGATLADLRDDRVVAIDANPDRGTLGSKVPRTSPYTVRELLDDSPRLNRYVDIRRYLSQSSSRLEVLASANDPEISDAFEDSDYRAVDDLLQRYYSILLTDCGTGILHSAMHGVLSLADTLVIVTSSNADGGSSASATLDWLEAHGYADQVRESVSVISMFPQQGEAVDVDALEAHFAARTRRVVRVPWDPHLASGGEISLPDLKRDTRRAYREIAAAVAERFSPMDPADPFLG